MLASVVATNGSIDTSRSSAVKCLASSGTHGVQDEMLPPEHMERMYKMLLHQQGQVTWLAVHAGHMDAYETAAQASLPLHTFAHLNAEFDVGCRIVLKGIS